MQDFNISFPSYITHETQDGYNPFREFEYEELINKEVEDFLELSSWRDIYSSCTKNDPLADYLLANTNFSSSPLLEIESQPEISISSEILNQENPSDLDSLDLLKNYTSGFTKSTTENCQDEANKLSTAKIIRMGGKRYIHCRIKGIDHNLVYTHCCGSSFSGLSNEKIRDVDLCYFLLAAAEKVGYNQFEQATTLLAQCEFLASDTGNSIQRVIYYFSHALRERIERNTGKFVSRTPEEIENPDTNLIFLKFHQEIPFNQVAIFTGVQAILERVENKKDIHLIDFQIRSGVQWTALIRSLVERRSNPVQHLKITAIALGESQKVNETGKSLEDFALSMNLPFSYSVIVISDLENLRNEHFQIKACEAIVVYCPLILKTMISRPYCLQHVMRVIKKLNPSMMVLMEVEANLNSPSFFNRFIETLIFYSAYFDCLEDCTDRNNHYRNILERKFLASGIYNIVAAEREERTVRAVKMNVWGTFFQRFGMLPLEISRSSLCQAKLLVDQFTCKDSCNLEIEGNCLAVSWKNTPIQAVSTWKFSRR